MVINSIGTVAVAVVAYLAISWCFNQLARRYFVGKRLGLPQRLFSRSRHAELRDAWTDIAIGSFALASIGLQVQADGWLIAVAATTWVGAIVLRAAGDCDAARTAKLVSK